jgi:indole-3-glycerol phosphate synthase
VLLKVHDEREMDRVLGIDGVQLIGINNRNLGMFFFTLIQFLVTPDKSFSYFITWKLVDSYQSIKPLVYVSQMSP